MYSQGKIRSLLLVLVFILVACSPQQTEVVQESEKEQIPVTGGEVEEEVTAPEPIEISFLMPSLSVPEPVRTLQDTDSSVRAGERRGVGGDNYTNNLYERPFSSEAMDYQPDLDIQTVDFAFDDNFFFYTIRLEGMNPDPWGLNGAYGIEIDLDKDGRGDVMILAESPGSEWSVENVQVLEDSNGDVGGPDPLIPNTGFSGSGYDLPVEFEAEKAAFARIDPNDSEAVQIAFHRSVIGNPEEFLWSGWADNGIRDLAMFYYNDAFSLSDAGSPLQGIDYPVKEVYNLDNTCRLPYGFDQSTSNVPGMCINVAPVVPKSTGGSKEQCQCLYWNVSLYPPVCMQWSCE